MNPLCTCGHVEADHGEDGCAVEECDCIEFEEVEPTDGDDEDVEEGRHSE